MVITRLDDGYHSAGWLSLDCARLSCNPIDVLGFICTSFGCDWLGLQFTWLGSAFHAIHLAALGLASNLLGYDRLGSAIFEIDLAALGSLGLGCNSLGYSGSVSVWLGSTCN